MSSSQEWNSRDAWRRFRLEAETAKNYPLSYALGAAGNTHKDILLEQLLPLLLYIKGASILDDSLADWLQDNNHILRKPYKNDFNGRITYLNDNSLYEDCDELHKVRNKRNTFAHKPGVYSTWEELENDVSVIEKCLVSIGKAVESKKLEYFAERSAAKDSDDPKVICTRRVSYGIKEEGIIALEIAWDENLLRG